MKLAPALLMALVILLAPVVPAKAEPKFPPLTGRIVDEAHLLKPEDKAAIESELKALEAKSSDQLVIYTTNSLQGYPIEEFGYQLGRAWGIGQKGLNNGVILLVAPKERKVRIEVGRGLEPLLTDLLTSLIIRNRILPAFRRGEFSAGIRAGVQDIRDAMLGDAEAVKQRAAAQKTTLKKAPLDKSALTLFFIIMTFVIIFWVQSRHARQQYRGKGYGGPIFFPGGWSGGSGGGGGGGDSGGWSGGGGDFGGGGASGDW